MTRLTVAGELAESRPALAGTLAPHLPEVLVSKVMTQIGEAAAEMREPPQSALDRLRTLGRVAPLNAQPFLVEAALALRQEDADRSERLLLEARRLDPREPAARYLLADLWLRQGRIVEGIGEMAILARLVPGGSVQLVPALSQYARTPGAGDRLKEILAANPSLKQPLLNALASEPSNVDLILDLHGSVPGDGAAQPAPWQSRLLNGLVDEGAYERAYALWQRLVGFRGPRPLLYNGEFRQVPAPPPFNWTFASAGSGFAEPGEGAMRVLYYGREDVRLASQLLLLQPGSYRFSAAVSGEPAQGSLSWAITCAGSGKSLMALPLASAPAAQMQFQVPASECPAQMLALEGKAQDVSQESDVRIGPVRVERVGS